MKKKKRNKGGRPTEYNKAICQVAGTLAEFGASDRQVYTKLKISQRTFYTWKKEHPEFGEAIASGRQRFDNGEIERSLIQQAKPHDEVTVYHELKGRGKERKMLMVGKKTKQAVVNVPAAERVLKANMPEKYGDKLEHRGGIQVNINIKKHYEETKPDINTDTGANANP